MGPVGVGVAYALHDRQASFFIEAGQPPKGGMKTDLFLGPQFQDLVFAQGQAGPGTPVVIIPPRDHGVKTVVAPGQLQNHENLSVAAGHALNKLPIGSRMQGEHGILQKAGNGPAKGAAEETGAKKFPSCFQFRFFHGLPPFIRVGKPGFARSRERSGGRRRPRAG